MSRVSWAPYGIVPVRPSRYWRQRSSGTITQGFVDYNKRPATKVQRIVWRAFVSAATLAFLAVFVVPQYLTRRAPGLRAPQSAWVMFAVLVGIGGAIFAVSHIRDYRAKKEWRAVAAAARAGADGSLESGR